MKNTVLFLVFIIAASCNNLTQKQIDYGSNDKVGKFIDINDIKIYYEIYGEGEPILLLHGNADLLKLWYTKSLNFLSILK